MKVKTFIEKAIRGGWSESRARLTLEGTLKDGVNRKLVETTLTEKVLLDPLAWKAVGEVEVWEGINAQTIMGEEVVVEGWELKMHQMVDHLISGGTLEDYIESL